MHQIKIRTQIDVALRRTTDLKLLNGAPEEVLQTADEAHQLAKGAHEPWPQLTAYRLAQLLCRESDLSVDGLKEIDQLFESSVRGRSKSMGPLPRIYQLAILHRLKIRDPQNQDLYNQRIKSTFQDAADTIHLPSLVNSQHRDKFHLQGDQFNLLELASYFLELPYSPLLGSDDASRTSFDYSGSWIIVSNQADFKPIRYTERFAEIEVESLLLQSTEAIGFKIHEHGVDGSIGHGPADAWADGNAEQLRLLANLLHNPDCPRTDLLRKISNEAVSDENFRQIKRRLKQKLKQLICDAKEPIYGDDNSIILPIPIYGIVPSRFLKFR
ncbi:MAG: hypothetical protein GY818_18990 [Planctomycetaceae bacterium]|nr:hypothetical protein [Planctomycetaceae bacterium]